MYLFNLDEMRCEDIYEEDHNEGDGFVGKNLFWHDYQVSVNLNDYFFNFIIWEDYNLYLENQVAFINIKTSISRKAN